MALEAPPRLVILVTFTYERTDTILIGLTLGPIALCSDPEPRDGSPN